MVTRKITKRERDIVLQWARGEITMAKVEEKLKKRSPSSYITIARTLKAIHYPNAADEDET